MEFHESLQHLRRQKNLTQEELAKALYVSRTAISKWESGRGFPNIESLKAIAAFFGVSLDELLSGETILTIAEEEHKQAQKTMRDLLFGLLDCAVALLLFLPLFGQQTDSVIREVSLLGLIGVPLYVKTAYLVIVALTILLGVLTLALQNWQCRFWVTYKRTLSLVLGTLGVILFILGRQPYAAVFIFVFLIIKALMLLKRT